MKPVRIYTTTYCGYCVRAKQLLQSKGVDFEEIDVTEDQALRTKLVEMTGGIRTVPQIWIGEKYVGGYTDLAQLDREGGLKPLLDAAGAQPGT